eukprot:SAG11_NODE_1650_length_4510_cov_6.795738_1_plen_85_part_00
MKTKFRSARDRSQIDTQTHKAAAYLPVFSHSMVLAYCHHAHSLSSFAYLSQWVLPELLGAMTCDQRMITGQLGPPDANKSGMAI